LIGTQYDDFDDYVATIQQQSTIFSTAALAAGSNYQAMVSTINTMAGAGSADGSKTFGDYLTE
jgi:hypothetical protein